MINQYLYTYNKTWYLVIKDICSEIKRQLSIECEGMSYNWSILKIRFDIDLSDEQEDSLSDIIDSYEHNYYLVYDYVEEDHIVMHHFDINYNILWLKKERIFVKWELSEVKYRASYDSVTKEYSGLVVKETNTYARDSYWYIQYREKKIYRYEASWTESSPKLTYKYYSPLEATQAWESRRTNIINQVKIETVGLIAQTELVDIATAEWLGFNFLDQYTMQVQQYRDWDRQPLIDSISNHDTSLGDSFWLDNLIAPWITVRLYLVGELTY